MQVKEARQHGSPYLPVSHIRPLYVPLFMRGCIGATFPLICHAGVKPDDRAGRGLSWLYVSNIIGSTLGSFVVGYILMDIWPVRSIAIALAITGLALGASMLIASEKGFSRRALAVGISCGLAVAIVAASGPLF